MDHLLKFAQDLTVKGVEENSFVSVHKLKIWLLIFNAVLIIYLLRKSTFELGKDDRYIILLFVCILLWLSQRGMIVAVTPCW